MSTELVAFDPSYAATVAAWPTSEQECVWWCGCPEFPLAPRTIVTWANKPDVNAYVLLRGDDPIGYGELWHDEAETELARLIIAPAERGRGAGRHLVNALIDLTTGMPLVFLRVHPDNTRAIKLYLATGFHRADAATEAEWNDGQPRPYLWFVQ
ncbi:MAG TPA: GNAT family N-acetyltransferase [Pseudonocardiaceae bacterium]|nr:GNAT family N-acetyltransferase [Pseudonocardiaceae bacterium]